MTCKGRWTASVLVAVLTAVLWPLAMVWAEEAPAEKPAQAAVEEAASAVPSKVAEVNGKQISYEDYTRQLEIMKQRVLKGRPGQLPEPMMQQIQNQVVQQMVAEELLFQESLKKGIKIQPKAVDAELLKLKQRFGTEDQYKKTLQHMNLTEEKLRVQIAHQAAIRKLVEGEISSKVEVTEADSKKYFEENTEKFRQPERVRARHILIKVSKGDDEQKKAAARKKLADIKKKIMAGDDFSELAKTYSEGPSNSRGGDLGYFTRGRMVPSFEEAAFKLAPNEISDIVETQFGFHLIKLVDRQEAKDPDFEQVKQQITNALKRQEIQKLLEPYVAKLKESAKIETFLK